MRTKPPASRQDKLFLSRPAFLLAAWVCIFASFIAAVPICRAQAPGTAPTSDDVVKALNSMREGMVAAFNKRDLTSLVGYLHPDVVITWQNAEVSRGQDDVRRYYERMLVGPDSVVESITTNPEVEARSIYGDHVISYGHMNDEFTLRDGRKFRLDSRFSALTVKEDGRFVLAGLHLSGNLFNNEILDLTKKATMRWTGIISLLLGGLAGWFIAKRKLQADIADEIL